MGWDVDVRAGGGVGVCMGWEVDVRLGGVGVYTGWAVARLRFTGGSGSQAVPVHRRFRFVTVPVHRRFRFATITVHERFRFMNGSGLQCADPGNDSARFGSLDGSVWRFRFGSCAS